MGGCGLCGFPAVIRIPSIPARAGQATGATNCALRLDHLGRACTPVPGRDERPVWSLHLSASKGPAGIVAAR